MVALPLAVVTIPFFHGKPINIWFGIVLAVMISFQDVRVPPLDLQLAVSERRGLTDRADKIRAYMLD